MAKRKEAYTLKLGRMVPFRRTVKVGKNSVQLVFEPGCDLELSSEELEQCQDLIDTGMIVPANRDAKGRLRVVRERTEEDAATIESLEAQIAEKDARIAELEKQLDEATTPSE